jgi:hypothetical protein
MDSSSSSSAPAAVKATAQSRTPTPSSAARAPQQSHLGERYTLGPAVRRAAFVRTYERRREDPVFRPLKVYALDPAASKLDGATAVISVPYEPLRPGPRGAVFEVVAPGGKVVDLEDSRVLLGQGVDPSPSSTVFHHQMVYAVASATYAVFRSALGRKIAWGFDRPDPEGCTRLRIRPHASEEGANAAYDRNAGEVRFGCFPMRAAAPRGRNVPGGPVYTCLSHDIIVHELTHAVLDGLRSHFLVPTGPDVLAFHEGFADVVAVLQHFTFRDLLESEIRNTRNDLSRATLLPALAQAFGMAVGQPGTLRSAVDAEGHRRVYRQDAPPHDLGNVLLAAVYDAFCILYRRKTERFIALCPDLRGDLPAALVSILADQASKLASQLLALCVRALDYCPPVDITLGEFLRAVITADRDLVPHDPWAFRETLIDAFAARGIYPDNVEHLSEDALLWRPLPCDVEPVERLTFGRLQFAGDPASPANAEELQEQACALGDFVTRPDLITLFGLASPHDTRLSGDRIDLPCVQSIRSARRVGPDGQIVFDLVAEVTQTRYVRDRLTGAQAEFIGGCTIILGPNGEFRYVILKSVLNRSRLERQLRYQGATRFCERHGDQLRPVSDPLRLLHRGASVPIR